MRTRPLVLLVVSLALVVGLAGPASASGGGTVRVNGTCSAGSLWKLKAKSRDANLEVEFEVDSNKNGQVWNARLEQNGATVFNGNRTTVAPSGSFGVSRTVPDTVGSDRLVGVATNARTGERCRGVLTV